MKNKTALTLLLILFLGVNAFSFNTFKNVSNKNKIIPAFEVAACPDNVTNNTIGASSTTICSGESVTFTGSIPDITPDMDSSFQWQSDASGDWLDIDGATEINYTTGNLTVTTSFKRLVLIAGCETTYESNSITITVNVVSPPNGAANQSFCSSDNPTVADLNVDETNVTWYDDAGLTNSIPETTALSDGTTYYVTQSTGSCESSALAVTVEIVETPAPPSGAATQSFCSSDNPTLADLVVSGTDKTWYDDAGLTNSIPETTALSDGTTYYVTQSTGSCESSALAVTVEVNPTPTLSAAGTNPDECGGTGVINFIFTNVPAGTQTISYNEGTFDVSVAPNGTASYPTSAGTFENLTITIDGCTSLEDVDITISDPNPPNPPNITVENECGFSTLTASDYTGSLLWSTGENTQSIIVTEAGEYTVTQTVNGCTSAPATANAAPTPEPSTPTVSVQNECGQSILTASNYTGSLLWSNGETTQNITVTEAGEYTVTQTLNGCTSNPASATASPVSMPTLTVSSTDDPATCGGTGTINFTFTNVPNGTYTIFYDGGSFSGVEVSNNTATVEASAGSYLNLTIEIAGCTSADGENATLTDPNPPNPPSITVENECGFSTLTASNYTGSLLWSTGENTQSIIVTEAGEYTVTQTVNGCTSAPATANATPAPEPSAPTVSVQNECGQSTLTASNYTGSLLWSTGETSESITVTEAGAYTVTQTVNGCTSNPATANAAPRAVPTVAVTEIDPILCLGLGTLNFTFSNVPGGLQTIEHDAGSFENVLVIAGSASVLAPAGAYTNLRITINGCTSANGVNAALNDPNAPDAPTILVENLCGESVLTATNYDPNATLEWSTGETGESITVTEAKTYSVTQELNGCVSDAATAMAAPKTIPAAPDFSVTDNCDGTSTLTAIDFEDSAQLEWSTGETTTSITVNETGEYSLQQIVEGCASELITKTITPKTAPAITVLKSNPETCGSLGVIDFIFTGVPDGIYTIQYDGGIFEEVTVSNNTASVSTGAGTYSNLTITIGDCSSATGINVTLTEPNAPDMPNIIVDNRCGETVLTATGYDANALLEWSTGETTATIRVNTAGTYSVSQTLNGCTSDVRTATATPKAIPDEPDFTVTNHCDGTSTLTAVDFENNAILQWSTGETRVSITVTSAGSYSLSQILNGCQSNAVTKVVSLKTAPTITATAVQPENCGEEGVINFIFTDVPDGIYEITYDNGNFTSVEIENNAASVETTAGSYNNLMITVDECTSEEGVHVTLSEPNAPETPVVGVVNGCNESVLTVTGYDESATLLWNTGDTGQVLTVTAAGTYTVTQEINGCTSDAASVVAEPKISNGLPEIELIDDCGGSVIYMNNLPTNTWFVWEFNNTTDSTRADSITVMVPGEYTLFQRTDGCISQDTTITVNPLEVPEPPVSEGDVLVCIDDSNTIITAEATVADTNAVLVWYDKETGGNEVLLPVLDSLGTITYYAEAKYPETGCASQSRTPVTLTILQSAKTLILDSTIIGKPKHNVAVLIFPENVTAYQWYMNNSEIPGATEQYYYIPEPDRDEDNLFSVEVEIANGCKATYSYSYSDLLNSAIVSDSKTTEIAGEPSFKVYPNPANQEIYISLDVSMLIREPDLNAKIFSVNGTCLNEFRITKSTEKIDTRGFVSGIYSVVLYGGQGTFYTKKIIISH